jgi:hypothetical protein
MAIGSTKEGIMPALLPDCREGIRWYPRSTIEKYTADQVAYVRRRRDGPLDGWDLHDLCHVPEGGTVYDQGNGVVASGLANLVQLLTGEGGNLLAPGRTVFGVGSDGATLFNSEQVRLANADGESPEASWYRPMDYGYPRVCGPASIEGQATFAETEACFEWHEWCWAAGPVKPAAHHSLSHVYGELPVMINRKASLTGFGLKEPGVAWVFRTVVELLSL